MSEWVSKKVKLNWLAMDWDGLNWVRLGWVRSSLEVKSDYIIWNALTGTMRSVSMVTVLALASIASRLVDADGVAMADERARGVPLAFIDVLTGKGVNGFVAMETFALVWPDDVNAFRAAMAVVTIETAWYCAFVYVWKTNVVVIIVLSSLDYISNFLEQLWCIHFNI